MTQAEPFLRTILEQPDIDGPRLVFADWLEEQGDPHAELIRVQCELARLAQSDPQRERLSAASHELIERHEAHWLQPIRDLGLAGRFRRGFLEVNVTGVRKLLDARRRLTAFPWVLHVHLQDSAADLEDVTELAESPVMARLQRLDLSRSGIGSKGAQALAASKIECRLKQLNLSHIQLSSSGLKALIEAMNFSRLTELWLSHNGIGAVGAKALSVTPKFKALRMLDLSYNQMGNLGAQYLSESHYLGRLESLHVRSNSIGVKGKKYLRRRFGPRVHLGGGDSSF